MTPPCIEPIFAALSGALMRRIATRSSPSCFAALSINGSMAAAIWFWPGPRCGPRGGVFVITGTPRKRIAGG